MVIKVARQQIKGAPMVSGELEPILVVLNCSATLIAYTTDGDRWEVLHFRGLFDAELPTISVQ